VVAKSDLPYADGALEALEALYEETGADDLLHVSVFSGEGVEPLETAVFDLFHKVQSVLELMEAAAEQERLSAGQTN